MNLTDRQIMCFKTPYENRMSNSRGQISFDIRTGVPPAKRPSTATVQGDGVALLWDIFERCWNLEPARRPSAETLGNELDKYETFIIKALENQAHST